MKIPRMRRAWKVALLALGWILLLRYVLILSVVRGTSMNPTFVEDDRILVDRLALWMGEPLERGDLVVFGSPIEPGVEYLKRVIGLPGDEIRLERGRLFVNGGRVEEDYALADLFDHRRWVVPEGRLFVLGDNRPRSCDSRSFDTVPLASVQGKVRARIWPLERAQLFGFEGAGVACREALGM